MNAGTVAVLAVLTGAAELTAPIGVTAGAWTCPACRRVHHVVLTDNPDDWIPDPAPCPCPQPMEDSR